MTSRDTGVLAAIGVARVEVWRRPIVAILSTGDEIIAPGEPMRPAKVYDSNAQVLADAVRELGGEPKRLGITHDDVAALRDEVAALRAEVAELTLIATAKVTGKVLDDSDHKRLIEDAISDLDFSVLEHPETVR